MSRAGKEPAMIGSTAGPTLNDIKPIRHHWVLLLMTLVCGGLLVAIIREPALAPQWKNVAGVLVFVILVLGSAALGGPVRLFTDWFKRNFWGYYWVLRRTAQNTLTGEFVNARHRDRFTWDAWTLYLPVGGWFTRPFFRYRGRSPSSAFHITRVNWDSMGQVESITVWDDLGNRLTHHPAWFLERIHYIFPSGAPFGSANTVLRLASVDAERLCVEKMAIERERNEARAHWKSVSYVVCADIRVLEGWLEIIDSGTRLHTTREGKKLRHRISDRAQYLRATTSHALHPECSVDSKETAA